MGKKKGPVPDLETLIASTPPSLLKKIRDIACPPGHKGNWMKFLSDKQFLEVFHRLRAGEPANRIVVKCQKEWGIKPTSKAGSLARSLRKFRTKAVGNIFDTEVTTTEEKKEVRDLSKRGREVAEKIDAFATLGWLVDIQADRVQLAYDLEKQGIPFRFTDKSVKVLGELLEQYHNMEQDLGLGDGRMREASLSLKVSAKFKELVSNTMEDGEGVAAALNRMVEMAEDAAYTLEAGEDGQFQLVGPEGKDAKSVAIPESAGDSGGSVKGDGSGSEGSEDS